MREYDRQRALLPYRQENVRARAYRYRDKFTASAEQAKLNYPERDKARTALNNAVRDGRVQKPSLCERCLLPHTQLHGHHSNYSQPLNVAWLCPVCHGAVHRALNEINRNALHCSAKEHAQ
jgi:hypothetical protein